MQRPIMTSRSFLRTPSEPADPAAPADQATITDLVDTLEANRSRCVGMAANMIGVGKRIIAFVDEELGGRITVMLNPVITVMDGAYETAEGCLSLAGERRTRRYRRIEVDFEDRRGRSRHATFTDFTAEIIQHEVDHCNGIII
ncbi:peptide deformylase [Bifidobacterium jacchi]|uniref:Peptide deformylase n=1 Tax=Bifidobacterium jacchi TaxID=2490545 RepID=A0A5N5RDE9_9BIFI|nr:peptide deformylase [Bifidobacterium jacchi]KAB5604911.1 peptide deformylase [Bifidobacterium jacchi]